MYLVKSDLRIRKIEAALEYEIVDLIQPNVLTIYICYYLCNAAVYCQYISRELFDSFPLTL